MSAELAELTINLGPRHNIRIRRPYIKRDNFETKYGGYIVFFSALVIIVFCILRVDRVLFLATHFHASFGDADAQFLLGQHYVQGHGVEKNMELGMSWFKKSADNGHPHASYNVGYGHIKKLHKLLNKGDAEIYISAAADAGMEEAQHAMKYFCSNGFCSM